MFFIDEFVTLYSQLFSWWLNWLFILGFKKPLEVDDLGTMPAVHTAEYNHRRFKRNFQKEVVS